MLNERLTAARGVASSLRTSESSIDAALLNNFKLAANMIEARSAAKLSALYGQEALEEVTRASAALVDARRLTVEAHKKLAEVQHDIGLSTRMIGDDGEKPRMPGSTGAFDPLRVVA